MKTTNFDEIKEIIQIPSSLRTKSQLKLLSRYISNLSFFKIHIVPIGDDIVRKSCEYLHYEFYPINSYICKIGDPGDKFFIIIQGQVKVFIKPSEDSNLTEASTLGQGSSFGEYALLYNHPRIASILCTTDTHLAVLSKQSYLQILGSIENKRIENIIFFLKNVPLFKNWSKSALVRISYFFTELTQNRKTTVFREGETINKVFILKEGELELLKSLNEEARNKANQKTYKKNVQVSLLSKGEILGGEVLSQDKYQYSCKVNSLHASMLVISKEDFISRIRTEESQNFVKLSNEYKEQERVSRINSLKELKKMYKPIDNYDTEGQQETMKIYYKTPRVILNKNKKIKRALDCGITKAVNRLEITMKKSGLTSERQMKLYSPLVHRSNLGFFFKKYEYPMKIEKKKIFTRLESIEHSISSPFAKLSPLKID